MKEALIIGSGVLLCVGIAVSGPLVALAECRDIQTTRPQRCGLRCVIETKACDTEEEAVEFTTKHDNSKPYKLKGSDKWFVDYMITELEANLIE